MRIRTLLPLLVCLGLAACAYKVEILQGSILKPADISQLKLGMNKAQVEYILGTPSVINTLNQERWDYIYRSKHGKRIREKKGYLVFNDNRLGTISMDEFLR